MDGALGERWLGSAVSEVVFEAGSLSAVAGLGSLMAVRWSSRRGGRLLASRPPTPCTVMSGSAAIQRRNRWCRRRHWMRWRARALSSWYPTARSAGEPW
jgi:hypothetical protein